MTDASSKIDVRRPKVGDLLIQILVRYALLDPSNTATLSS